MAKLVAFNDKTYYDAEVRLASDPQHAQHTKNETPEQYRAVEEAFGRTDAGKIWKRWMFGSNFLVNRDGTFRIDNLPPGKYTVNIRNFEDQPEVNFIEDVARTEGAFEVPADTVFAISAGGGAATSQPSTDPINIGTLVPKAITRLRPGDVAPQFTVKMLDGTTFKSADQNGKAIVVVFWGTWSNTDRLVAFGDFARKWKSDPRVVIIGDYQSDDDAKAAKWVKDAKLEFPQAKDDTLMHTLDSSWPEAVLISPDGKIVQKHLQGKTLDKFLRRVLGMETSTTKSPASPRSQ
jgi:peroxiredoxin